MLSRPKKVAEQLIEEMGIEGPIVNVFEVAEREGITVKYFRPEGELKEVAGFYDPDKKIIYVNAGDVPQRQVFTIAHELGHHKLAHKKNQFGVLMRFQNVAMRRDPLEKQADEFAGNLLVPESMLKRIMREYKLDGEEADIEILSRLFGVSKEVIKIRLERVGKASFF